MATPYLQIRVDETPSTQDLARELLDDLPVVVIAAAQSEGRGRGGSPWQNAPRSLAVSVALELPGDDRPLSLMAGVAAARALGSVVLKWPNDVLSGDLKLGGILVERSDSIAIAGIGVNLWWPDPPPGVGALYTDDPGVSRHVEMGSVWAAELMRLVGESGWPLDEYRAACSTLGRVVTWEPRGKGRAIDIAEDGSLIVDSGTEVHSISSGAVSHVRG